MSLLGNATIGSSNGGSNQGSSQHGVSTNEGYSIGGTYGTGATASALSHQMMIEANEFNAQQAEINRKWQEKMSNTAYQRAVKDLKKAGINPILAYVNPASTPGGSYASSAMGQAYTDSYSESKNSGQSENWGSSWGNSWEHSETSSDIANQIAAITGLAGDLVGQIINKIKGNTSAEETKKIGNMSWNDAQGYHTKPIKGYKK